jgi:hypothetical protein
MAEQYVHGGVEARIYPDQEYQDSIPYEGDDIDQENGSDEDADIWQLWEKPQKKEVYPCFISCIHVLNSQTSTTGHGEDN